MSDDLAAIYDAHAAWMYRHALMVLGDHAAAEDAVQQVFVKLAARAGPLGGIESPAAYLRAAVRRESYRMLERRRRRSAGETAERGLLEAIADSQPTDDPPREELEAALRELPPEQRELVYLRIYEGMTFRRVGEVLGIPLHTAASRYRYAIEKLRRRLSAAAAREGR